MNTSKRVEFAFLGMACWLIAFVLAMPVLQAQTPVLPPGKYMIGGISVEGVEFSDPNTIISISGLQVNSQIDWPSEAFSDAVKNLWRQNLYSDIQFEVERRVEDKLFLVLKLEERPRIARYTFKGVTKSQGDDLRDKVNFVRGQRFTEAKSKTAKRLIRNYFQEKGYLNVEVTIDTRPDETMKNGVVVVANIKKGEKVKVRSVLVQGNQNISAKSIRRKLKNTKEKRLYRFWSRSKYVPATYREDKEKVVEYLRSKGHRDAEIVSDTVIQVNKRLVDVSLNLYEGSRYYIRSIAWTGNFKYSDGYLDTLLGIKKGAVYNSQLLERRLIADPAGNDISSLYLDDGYLFFRADPVELLVANDSVDLEIRMFEGPQATYDRIFVEGNTITSDFVVLRQVRTLPGQKFSRAEIIRSQREILNLGYFSQENLQVTPIPHPEKGTVDVKYVVEERPNNQFFLQGGWGGRITDSQGQTISSGVILTVGVSFNNFSTRKFLDRQAWSPLPSGDGQQLGFRIQAANGFQNYAINFMEPWLGGRKPISLGSGINFSRQQDLFGRYRMDIIGTSVDLGNQLKWPVDFFRTFTSLSYRYYDVRGAEFVFSSIPNGFINILSLRQTFDRTSIDVPIFSTTGSILNFSVEATPPWHLFRGERDWANLPARERYYLLEYHKWKFRVETFSKLTRVKLPLVFYARAQFGFMGLYNRDIGQSPFERFYLGGDGIMGFNLDGRELIALRGYNQPNIGGRFGNTIMAKYTFELRQPLTLSPAATLWLHGFAEAGNAWSQFENFNPFSMVRSFGAGVRIFLPMLGLLGVDYGYGIDNVPFVKNKGNFHFMIGQQF